MIGKEKNVLIIFTEGISITLGKCINASTIKMIHAMINDSLSATSNPNPDAIHKLKAIIARSTYGRRINTLRIMT